MIGVARVGFSSLEAVLVTIDLTVIAVCTVLGFGPWGRRT